MSRVTNCASYVKPEARVWKTQVTLQKEGEMYTLFQVILPRRLVKFVSWYFKNKNHSVQHTITRSTRSWVYLFGPLGIVGPVEYVENEKRQWEASTG